MALAEYADDRWHEVVRDGGEETNPQFALLALRRATHGLERAVSPCEHRPRLAKQHLTHPSQRSAAGAPLEQPNAELQLERTDLLGKRLLGDVQAPGRAREAPFLC